MPSVYMVNMKRSLLLERVDLKVSTLYLKVCKKMILKPGGRYNWLDAEVA